MENIYPSFTPFEGKEPYIFCSYSKTDAKTVIPDLNKLDKMGFRVWYDYGLGPGEWKKSIQMHIKNSKVFLIFVSDASLNSEWVEIEVCSAKSYELTIIPIFIKKKFKTESMTLTQLKEITYIERFKYKDNSDDSFRYYLELERQIEKASKEVRKSPRDRDSKMLGLGYLPTFKDIYSSKKPNYKLYKERRVKLVFQMPEDLCVYVVDNIFQITSDKTNALENLEDFNEFESNSNKPTNLVSLPLDICESYLSPLRLINGLITRLDENWPPLVKSYRKLVMKNSSDLLDDFHYFIEFCWLAWGPSVLTATNTSEDAFIILQCAYGDEANSLPLIVKKTLWRSIKKTLDASKDSQNGWPVKIQNALLVKPGIDMFFSEIRGYPLVKDMFSGDFENKIALYLPDRDDGDYGRGDVALLGDDDEPDSFYSTAYVWLMLEQIDKADFDKGDVPISGKLKPGKVLPFFEHANLATKKSLGFLQHCLARKAIHHVLECDCNEDYQMTGYYRFATGLFPEQILKILMAEIEKLNADQQSTLKKRLIIPNNIENLRKSVDVVKFADDLNTEIKNSLLASTMQSTDQ